MSRWKAEISRERFEAERFELGQKVGLRFRRWQVYPAAALNSRPRSFDGW